MDSGARALDIDPIDAPPPQPHPARGHPLPDALAARRRLRRTTRPASTRRSTTFGLRGLAGRAGTPPGRRRAAARHRRSASTTSSPGSAGPRRPGPAWRSAPVTTPAPCGSTPTVRVTVLLRRHLPGAGPRDDAWRRSSPTPSASRTTTVEVRIGDTDESLWGFGAFSSRQAVIGGGAAHLAGEHVRDKALALAAGAERGRRRGPATSAAARSSWPGRTEADRSRWPRSPGSPTSSPTGCPRASSPGSRPRKFYDPIRGAFAAGVQLGARGGRSGHRRAAAS